MTVHKTEIAAADVLDPDAYEEVRAEKRASLIAAKRDRRLAVGPDATIYFENWDTMWLQIQEMLRIEKGGAAQLADELAAYNPMVPKGRNLSATFMIEIADEARRDRVLSGLGDIDKTVTLQFDGETVTATADDDVERTSEEGKASSVHFLLFEFSDGQVEKFRAPGAEIVLSVGHENYRHMAVMPEAMRMSLAADFA